MKVGIIGLGVMGIEMAKHLQKTGDHEVLSFDVDASAVQEAAKHGTAVSTGPADIAAQAEITIIAVATGGQVIDVLNQMKEASDAETVAVVSSTVHPEIIDEASEIVSGTSIRLVDSPVVFGSRGARDGTLLCLCGGDEADIEYIRPVMMAFSRDVLRVGELGHGQLTKSVNAMLHWAHCVSNFEALLLAKRYGMDAQKLREVLIQCPGTNGTLERWDDTKLTWQEKDMDIVMDLAQKCGVTMPLFGQVDQLVKLITPEDIADLLYGESASYIGHTVSANGVTRTGG